MANMECLLPAEGRADMNAFDEQCNRDIEKFTPAGMHPSPVYGWYKPKVYQEGEKPAGTIYRPDQFFIRDVVILQILHTQAAVLGVRLECLLVDNHESGYLARDGKTSRKDVTHCAYLGCPSLSDTHLRCSACRSAYYCGSEHQKMDWPTHKVLCRATRTLFNEIEQQKLAGKFSVMSVGNVAFVG